jgi:hypothetical protein
MTETPTQAVVTAGRATWSTTPDRFSTLWADSITCPHGSYRVLTARYPTGSTPTGAVVGPSEWRNHQVLTGNCGCVLVLPASAETYDG